MTDLDRPMAERLWQLYSHDLSQYRGTMPNAEGLYKAGRLPTYFGNPDTCGYVVTHDGANAGFVFVTGLTGEFRTVGDFFVVRAARRQRVGFDSAMHVLTRHRGPWEIGFQVENPRCAAVLAGRGHRGRGVTLARGVAARPQQAAHPARPLPDLQLVTAPPDVSRLRICWIAASCTSRCAWICLASSSTAEASS